MKEKHIGKGSTRHNSSDPPEAPCPLCGGRQKGPPVNTKPGEQPVRLGNHTNYIDNRVEFFLAGFRMGLRLWRGGRGGGEDCLDDDSPCGWQPASIIKRFVIHFSVINYHPRLRDMTTA
ncbi:hypothetical protein GWI33_013646 [Rhynchophorus ferrugineus]|uniref:Uncharacterized protein n=1 Tax=Rhynchophorus ferrugineus TaxID=354439 RepID=A0A834I477_RHYFE|nr:hypothetical protein GWI33_013646 [Rhynchophorus ferrugineus]